METLDYHLKAHKYFKIVSEAKKQYQLINYVFLIEYMTNQNYFKQCHEASYNFMMAQNFVSERFFVAFFDKTWKGQYGWIQTKEKLRQSYNANINSYSGNSSGYASVFESLEAKLIQNNQTRTRLNIIFILTNNNGEKFLNASGHLKNIIERPNNRLFIVDMAGQSYGQGYELVRRQSRHQMLAKWKLLPEINIYDISHPNNIIPFFSEIIKLKKAYDEKKINQEIHKEAIKERNFLQENLKNSTTLIDKLTIQNQGFKKQITKLEKIEQRSISQKNELKSQNTQLKKKNEEILQYFNTLKLQKQNLDHRLQSLQKENEELQITMLAQDKSRQSQINYLKVSMKNQTQKLQILISQGCLERDKEAKQWAEKLDQMHTSSIKQIHAIKQFREEIQVVMKQCSVSAFTVKLILDCKTTQFDHYLIKYYQKNQKNDIIEVAFNENTCIIKDLKPKTAYKFQVKVILNTNKSTDWQSNPDFFFHTNPSNQKEQFLNNYNQGQKKIFIDNKIKSIRQKFTFEIPLPEVKIGLFGSMSQGKSSAANTILSVLSQQLNFIAMSGNANESVTKRMFKVKDILQTEVPLTIIDTFGIQFKTGQNNITTILDSTNYKDCFDHYLRGTLYEEYENNDTLDRQKLIKFQDGIDRLCHEMHAVMYVISYEFLDGTDGIKLVSHILKQFRNRGIKPVIVLTKCDQLLENSPLSEIQSNKKVEIVLKDLKDKLGIDQEDIFLVVNYRSRKEDRDYDKQFYILKMLEEAILRARQRIYYRLQQFFWIQKDDNTFYGAIEKIGLETLGNKLEPIMNRSFKALGLQFKNLMFLKYEKIFGQTKEFWIPAENFKDTPIKYFIKQVQNKRIMKIKDNSANIQKIKAQTLEVKDNTNFGIVDLYDPIKKMKVGFLDLKRISLDEAMKIKQISIQDYKFNLINQKVEVEEEAYCDLTVGEIMQGTFIQTKIVTPLFESSPGLIPMFTVSFIDKNNGNTIDQFKMKYKNNLKNSQFLIQLRKKVPDILEEYKVCKLETERAFPDNDELAEEYLVIQNKQIRVNCLKK